MRAVTMVFCALLAAGAARAQDLAGTWAVERVVRTTFDVPVIGLVEQVQTIRALWTAVKQKVGYEITERLCGVKTRGSTNALWATLQPGFAKGASGTRFAALVEDGRFTAHGVAMVGTSTAPDGVLPTTADHPDIKDIDRDGQPGFTVTINGLVTGDIRIIRRERLAFSGSYAPRQISGDLDVNIEQKLLSASNSLLATPIPEKVRDGRFRGVRLGSGKGCRGAFKRLVAPR